MRIDRIIVSVVVMTWVGLLTVAPVQGHHAFAAEFDANRPVKVTGTLAKVEWTNPHAWFHIDVKNANGQVERWLFETGSPGALTRRGFTRDFLPIGTEIAVEGYMSKGVARRANGRVMTYASGPRVGQTLFVGSSGTGAPVDGRDAAEK